MLVKIEQRLQDPQRFLFLPADEAVLIGLPVMMGLLGRQAVTGIVVALLAWSLWKKIKGEGGIEMFLAATYWFLPSSLGMFRALPDSAVEIWEA